MYGRYFLYDFSDRHFFQVATHSGGCPGVSSMIALLPKHKAVITLQSSAGAKQLPNDLVFAEILAAITGSSQDINLGVM
jgi:hypothetical protein